MKKEPIIARSIDGVLPPQYIPYVRYSEAFKQKVVSEVDSGRLTRNGAKQLYHIKAWTSVHQWCLRYSKYKNLGARVEVRMAKEPTIEEVQKRNRGLEEELAFAKLKILSLETLIDLAERDRIDIRKNGGAKQSAR